MPPASPSSPALGTDRGTAAATLHVHRATRADRLADALVDVVRTPAGDAFAPEHVVAAGRSLERLVRERIAQGVGVCANLRVASPSSAAESLLARLAGLPAGQDAAAWRRDRLAWAILGALPPLLGDARFAPVRFYLGDAPPGSARWVGLADRIAASFERYVLARAEMARRWDAGDVEPAHADDWQPVLWRALRAAAGGAPHLAALEATARARVAEGRRPAEPLPPRLTWITHAGVAPLHLRALALAARAGVQAHLFVVVPCPVAGHALGDSLGGRGQALDALLDAACEWAGAAVARNATAMDVAGDTVLAAVQRDVAAGTRRGPRGAPPGRRARMDDSLVVHGCHGLTRQVEVLRDDILRRLDADATLEPRDVLVLSPRMAEVAPLVDAVWSRAAAADGDASGGDALEDGAPPAVPFRVLDRPVRTTNPVADALLRALALAAGRLGAPGVMELVELPAVAARLDAGPGERELLRHWVRESGARWAADGAHRVRHGLADDPAHTWRFALDRLLLGVAMPDDDAPLWAGAAPCDPVEGRATELLGRFAMLCEALCTLSAELSAPRAMSEWRAVLSDAVRALVADDHRDFAWPAQAVRTTLDAMADDAERAGAAGAAPPPLDGVALRRLLELRLEESSTAGAAENGGVTFAALQPGRVVPARVVALLGMDDGCFPRPSGAAGFDLVARQLQDGDADRARDDRETFLEAVMAATDALVVCHTARDQADNSVVPPAVPVSELLDAVEAAVSLEAGAGSPRDAVTRLHPLQPFSPAAFGAAGGAPGYDRQWLAAARRLGEPRGAAPAWLARPLPAPADAVPDEAGATLSVEALADFLADPARALCRTRLAVSLGEWEDVVDAREPAELERRAAGTIGRALVARALDAGSTVAPDADHAPWRARALLPPGVVGAAAVAETAAVAREVAARVRALRGDGPRRESVVVDLEVDGMRLVGSVGPLWGDACVEPHLDRLWPDARLRWWVRHLALCAALAPEGARPRTCVVASDGDDLVLAPVADARARLAELVALWREGHERPLPLAPGTSHAWAVELHERRAKPHRDGKPAEQCAMEKAAVAWAGNDFAGGERARREHAARLLDGWCPGDGSATDARFVEVASLVWTPFLAASGAVA